MYTWHHSHRPKKQYVFVSGIQQNHVFGQQTGRRERSRPAYKAKYTESRSGPYGTSPGAKIPQIRKNKKTCALGSA